jgi:putative membrane protein insertion efficiency factor
VSDGVTMEDNKIPHYINDPVLNAATAPELKLIRPAISYKKAACSFGLFIVIVAIVAIVVSVSVEFLTIGKLDYGLVMERTAEVLPYAFLIAVVLCMRFLLIWLVKIYQHYAKSETRLRCCFEPSCSEYAVLALRKYGMVIGSIKTIRRLKHCHPPGGVDYP